MPKMILIAHNRYINATRHGANTTFHYFVQKGIDEGKRFYIYDPVAENQPKIEEVPKHFRAVLKGEIIDTPFYKNTDDVVLLGANISRVCYQKYTAKEFEKTVVELKRISEEHNVDIILWMKHRCVKKECI